MALMVKQFVAPIPRTASPSIKKKKQVIQKTPDVNQTQHPDVQRAIKTPNSTTLTPAVITQLQKSHGNQYVNRLIQNMRDDSISGGQGMQQPTIQREDEEGVVTKGANVGDIGSALVSVYEAYNGDDSANTIIKAITDLSGNLADTQGGVGDVGEGATSQGVGAWSRMVGGVTNIVSKGSELVSTLGSYGKSAMEYVGLSQVAEASAWIGGWAKSAAEYVSPYAYYTELVASGSKAVTGVTDGWSAGTIMASLAELTKSGTTADTKKAAEMLFNIAWWKRVEGYGQGAVGAIEGGAAVWFGPMSKGITAVLTKTYESGWGSYILRAIGSSASGSVYSNSDVQQKAETDQATLLGLIPSLVANGKIKDLVDLCKSAGGLGVDGFSEKILEAFDNPPSGKEQRYSSRKTAFTQQMES